VFFQEGGYRLVDFGKCSGVACVVAPAQVANSGFAALVLSFSEELENRIAPCRQEIFNSCKMNGSQPSKIDAR
jgi:hypothetical protein